MSDGHAWLCADAGDGGDDNDFKAQKEKFIQTGQKPPLKFSVSDPSGITAANSIADKPEADWLVQQMSAVLKRSA